MGTEKSSTLSSCVNYGKVTVNVGDSAKLAGRAAGIVGYMNGAEDSVLQKDYNTGTVTLQGEAVADSNSGAAGVVAVDGNNMDTCFNAGTVTGNAIAAGVAAYIEGTIGNEEVSGCYNAGQVNANEAAGAIYSVKNIDAFYSNGNAENGVVTGVNGAAGVVYDANCDVIECYNSAEVTATATGSAAAGVVLTAGADTIVDACYSNQLAAVNADCYSSGVVHLANGVVDSCFNFGTISSNSNNTSSRSVGVVNIAKGTVSNCYHMGGDFAGYMVAGVAGVCEGDVDSCYSSSQTALTGTAFSAGVACEVQGDITACYNETTIGASDISCYIACGVANSVSGKMVDCYNKGAIYGRMQAAGLVHTSYGSGFSKCFNSGAVTVTGGDTGIAAGIAYSISSDDVTIDNCLNAAMLNAQICDGIAMQAKATGTLKMSSCYNAGSFGAKCDKSLSQNIVGMTSGSTVEVDADSVFYNVSNKCTTEDYGTSATEAQFQGTEKVRDDSEGNPVYMVDALGESSWVKNTEEGMEFNNCPLDYPVMTWMIPA